MNDELVWQIAGRGSDGFPQTYWTLCDCFALDGRPTPCCDCPSHTRAEPQFGVSRIDDRIDVRLIRDVTLPKFDLHRTRLLRDRPSDPRNATRSTRVSDKSSLYSEVSSFP